jgi:hypothetical protein
MHLQFNALSRVAAVVCRELHENPLGHSGTSRRVCRKAMHTGAVDGVGMEESCSATIRVGTTAGQRKARGDEENTQRAKTRTRPKRQGDTKGDTKSTTNCARGA